MAVRSYCDVANNPVRDKLDACFGQSHVMTVCMLDDASTHQTSHVSRRENSFGIFRRCRIWKLRMSAIFNDQLRESIETTFMA